MSVAIGWSVCVCPLQFRGSAGTRSLPEAFQIFAVIHTITTTQAAITRITQEVVQDFAYDNVVHLELRTTPKARPESGLTKKCYCQAVLAGLQQYRRAAESSGAHCTAHHHCTAAFLRHNWRKVLDHIFYRAQYCCQRPPHCFAHCLASSFGAVCFRFLSQCNCAELATAVDSLMGHVADTVHPAVISVSA